MSQIGFTFHRICPPILIQTWLQQYCRSTFLHSAHCSLSNPISFRSVRCWHTMIPGKIFTGFPTFLGIVSAKWLLVSSSASRTFVNSFPFPGKSWFCTDTTGSIESAVMKSPKCSAQGTTVPVRLLQETRVILFLKQISQFRSFRKWVKMLCLPDTTFARGSECNSWEGLEAYQCSGNLSSTRFSLNSCSHSGRPRDESPRTSSLSSFSFGFSVPAGHEFPCISSLILSLFVDAGCSIAFWLVFFQSMGIVSDVCLTPRQWRRLRRILNLFGSALLHWFMRDRPHHLDDLFRILRRTLKMLGSALLHSSTQGQPAHLDCLFQYLRRWHIDSPLLHAFTLNHSHRLDGLFRNLRRWHIDDLCALRDALVGEIQKKKCRTGSWTICVRSEMRSWGHFPVNCASAVRCCTRSCETNFHQLDRNLGGPLLHSFLWDELHQLNGLFWHEAQPHARAEPWWPQGSPLRLKARASFRDVLLGDGLDHLRDFCRDLRHWQPRSRFSKHVISVTIKKRLRRVHRIREPKERFTGLKNLLMSKGRRTSIGNRFLIQHILLENNATSFPVPVGSWDELDIKFSRAEW